MDHWGRPAPIGRHLPRRKGPGMRRREGLLKGAGWVVGPPESQLEPLGALLPSDVF